MKTVNDYIKKKCDEDGNLKESNLTDEDKDGLMKIKKE